MNCNEIFTVGERRKFRGDVVVIISVGTDSVHIQRKLNNGLYGNIPIINQTTLDELAESPVIQQQLRPGAIIRLCQACGCQMHVYPTSTRLTCSDACRKRASRMTREADSVASSIMSQLQTLRTTLKLRPDLASRINDHLERIEGEVRDLRKLRPSDDMRALMDMQYDRARKY